MVRFERSKERNSNSPRRESSSRREGPPRRDGSDRKSFGGRPRQGSSRYATEESKRNSRNRRDFDMTKVTCSDCGCKCEVPFKPTSSKPVYCSDCFSKESSNNKKPKSGSSKSYDKEFEKINDKLDLIMKALHIK